MNTARPQPLEWLCQEWNTKSPNTHGMSDGDEWETVADSNAALPSDHFGLSFVRDRENSSEAQNQASSATQFSDVSSHHGGGHFPSTERIVQHPARKISWDFGYRVRNLKDTEIPVLVPNSGFHRVNGFVQNTSRPYLGGSFAASKSPAPSLMRKNSNPFRRDSPRRPRFSQAAYNGPQKHGRYSFQDSDSDDQPNAKRRSLGGKAKVPVAPAASLLVPETPKDQPDIVQSTIRGRTNTVGSSAISMTPTSDNTASFTHFNLIPLPEAARRQAERRASGLDDETTTGRARLQQAQSRASSKTTVMASQTSSPIPAMPKPIYRPDKRSMPRSPRLGGINQLFKDALGRSQPSFPTSSSIESQSLQPLTQNAQPFTTDSVESFRTFDRPYVSNGVSYGIPRLYTWDERRRIQEGTDPSLRSLAARGLHQDLERSLNSAPSHGHDGWVSWEAKRKRRLWFIGVAMLSIFPFISVLVHHGLFDSALSWYTQGEIHELSRRQKMFIHFEMWFIGMAWIAMIAILIYKYTR